MYVWSHRLVIGLLVVFGLLTITFLGQGSASEASGLNAHTTRWIALNYVGLLFWIFVWMIEQTRMRDKNVWVWLLPFLVAPLATLMGQFSFCSAE